jgi:hypothetical protein
MSEAPRVRIFVLKLRAVAADADVIRRLRWLLKQALRQHGFRCSDIREETDGTSE